MRGNWFFLIFVILFVFSLEDEGALNEEEYLDILKNVRISVKTAKEIKERAIYLKFLSVNESPAMRRMRWIATYLAARYFGIQAALPLPAYGGDFANMFINDIYCHQIRLKVFRCEKNKWMDFISIRNLSVLSSDFRVRGENCYLDPMSMDVTLGTDLKIPLTQLPSHISQNSGCSGGLTVSMTSSLVENLMNNPTFLQRSKIALAKLRSHFTSFPRQGVEDEPKCSYQSDSINVAFHLRRGDKRVGKAFPIGQQNMNILRFMHLISRSLDPELYAKYFGTVDQNGDWEEWVWRDLPKEPIFSEKPITFHIFTEVDDCPILLSDSEYAAQFASRKKRDAFIFELLLNEKAHDEGIGDVLTWQDVQEEYQKKMSNLPLDLAWSSSSLTGPFSVFPELGMWELEPQDCGYSYPVTCPIEFKCTGVSAKKCDDKYFCESFPRGVWKVKRGRGKGYLPHQIYIHANGPPEEELFCMSQADVIWSPCSALSQLSLFLAPHQKPFQIYSSSCKVIALRQTNLLHKLTHFPFFAPMMNDRIPVLTNASTFRRNIRRWFAKWQPDESRRNQNIYSQVSSSASSQATTPKKQFHMMYQESSY